MPNNSKVSDMVPIPPLEAVSSYADAFRPCVGQKRAGERQGRQRPATDLVYAEQPVDALIGIRAARSSWPLSGGVENAQNGDGFQGLGKDHDVVRADDQFPGALNPSGTAALRVGRKVSDLAFYLCHQGQGSAIRAKSAAGL